MVSYSNLKVAELKEELTKRSLATDGNKAQLVARLEENDSSKATEGDMLIEEDKPEESKEEPKEEAKEEPKEDVAETKEAEAKAPPEEKPKTIKELTPEERKAKAIEFLTKKIERARKFGTEEDVETAKKDLNRVEKFGIELGTTLAKEIGLSSRELRDKPSRSGRFRGKGRGFRGHGRR